MKMKFLLITIAAVVVAFSSCTTANEFETQEDANKTRVGATTLTLWNDTGGSYPAPGGYGPVTNMDLKITVTSVRDYKGSPLRGTAVVYNRDTSPNVWPNGRMTIDLAGSDATIETVVVEMKNPRTSGAGYFYKMETYVNYASNWITGNGTSDVTATITGPFSAGTPTLHVTFYNN